MLNTVNEMTLGECDQAGLVLTVRFAFGVALIVPEQYQREPFDPPCITYRELKGFWALESWAALRDYFELKQVFPDAKAVAVTFDGTWVDPDGLA